MIAVSITPSNVAKLNNLFYLSIKIMMINKKRLDINHKFNKLNTNFERGYLCHFATNVEAS